ncbi:MAG: hypothetical protein U1F27_12525 [Turneriella sp.]
MGLNRFKILHGFGISLFIAQMAGAFEVASAHQPKYYLCIHTKQKIEKGKFCPCGCSKRMKGAAVEKLRNADQSCADETSDTVLPSYARWVFTDDAAMPVPQLNHKAENQILFTRNLSSVFSEIETPPPEFSSLLN